MQAMQEAQDIDTGVDTRTKEEMVAEQMAGLGSAGKTAAESIPGVGEAIVAKEIAEDVAAGDYLSAGIGTAALGMGFLPAGDILNKPLLAAAKKFRKQDDESAKKLMMDDSAAETWKEANKLPESQRQKRVPEVQKAATDLSEGKITSKEYRRVVTANQPIKPITKENFPDMPTKTEIVGALKATDPRKVDTGIVGLNKNIPDGTRVGSRLDIPSYDNYDKWIVSLHDGTKRGGKAIGYGQTAVLKDVEFFSSAKGGLNIAKDKSKSTIARIHGDYYNAEPENVFEAAKKLIDDPQWTQVGMNPFRHSFFYDKATGNPVTRADEVIQVGPLVLAKGIKQPTISELKSLGIKTKDGKIRMFNEGGAVMQKQMEMFDDGGLMDEGGTVDPVSGNDVPPGSTQEEVRDDIPAQLSEGEFVFPADVVRYIGLGNLMRMRQEAKMGLKLMEQMGQMGNSEEATMPDDLPFDINDLDMEDEIDDNNELEMQVGGFVQPTQQQQQMGISGYQQAAAPTTGVAAVPQQAASQQYVQPVQPVQAAVPTMQAYKPEEVPTFQQTIGDDAFGTYDELRQYRNEAGNIINVPFRNGQPISPIPEGYTFVDPEETATEEVTTTPTTPQTTAVREEGGDDEARQRREEEMYGPGGGRVGVKDKIYGVSFDMPEGFMPGMAGAFGTSLGLATGKPLPEDVTVNFKRGETEFAVTGAEYNKFKTIAETQGYNSEEAEKALDEMREDALAKKAAKEKGLAEIARREKLRAAEEARKAATEAARKKAEERQREKERVEQQRLRELSETNINRLYGDSADRDDRQQQRAERQREADSFTREAVRGDVMERARSGKGFAEGGLASKPKPKTKKMKRGGLASKK